jgi:hypothetical protein
MIPERVKIKDISITISITIIITISITTSITINIIWFMNAYFECTLV